MHTLFNYVLKMGAEGCQKLCSVLHDYLKESQRYFRDSQLCELEGLAIYTISKVPQ